VAKVALALYSMRGDEWGHAQARRHLALHQHSLGHNIESLGSFRLALDLYSKVGSESGLALTYNCMTFLVPQDSSGTVSYAERLKWAIVSSGFYRKIRNPRGIISAEDTLASVTKDTYLTAETAGLLKQAEDEFREWARFELERYDKSRLAVLWRNLAETALKLDDKHAMAESLSALRSIRSRETTLKAYRPTIAGAYQRYHDLDLHPNTDQVLIDRISYNSGSLSERKFWTRYFELGRKMSLEEAVRYAIKH
jgi:hypothetical protein